MIIYLFYKHIFTVEDGYIIRCVIIIFNKFKNIKFIVLIVLFGLCIFFSYSIVSNSFSNSSKVEENNVELKDTIIISLLHPLISDAFFEHYGKNSGREYGLWSTKIIEAKKLPLGQFYFEITLEFLSYGDKYSPPYSMETITIRSDFEGVHVSDYKSEELPPDYNIKELKPK